MKESICLNLYCQRPYTRKTHWQKFCSDRCRLEAWVQDAIKRRDRARTRKTGKKKA